MSMRLTPAAGTGPLVAALGGLAAASIIAATIMGTGLTTDPWDVPAIARAPDGGSEPIVLAGGLVSGGGIPGGAEVGADSLLVPGRTAAGDVPARRETLATSLTSLNHQERTEPAPAEESMIEYVRKRLSDVVDGVGNSSHANGRRHAPGRKPPLERTIVIEAVDETEDLDEIDAEEATGRAIGDPSIRWDERVNPGDAAIPNVQDPPGEAQPDSSTTSGSASPLE